ncbi:hypothetical protein [Flavobacterium terrae]|uniref:CHAT domain-containing protein n=1 Tax=Flavobacterium terrae TaxID=415425 RepID=A0A1M6DLJ5_9FLAO|nr:hypothetical protein [Flavobacterium terrae]SHI73939.1 hypothetical protein SAMN05444363_1512 [Flavobacterium terrae]
MELNLPEFDNEFFCIINRDDSTLSALISSCIYKSGKYPSIFEYSNVTIEKGEYSKEKIDEHVITRTRAEEFNIKIKNTINSIGGCEYLILAGLTNNQKSYLDFLEDYNVIEIESIEDVEAYLHPIVDKNEYVFCNNNDIHYGLYLAAQRNCILKIDDTVPNVTLELEKDNKGIIVVENIKSVSTIIAVNYALSVNASLKLIESPEISNKKIKYLIEKWQEGDINSFNDLSALLYDKVQDINFIEYQYCTFFTIGAPYSLILKNVIPFTYVNLLFKPDFFVFNNLYFENREKIYSSIVFSPLEFGDDEEIKHVIKKFKDNNYFVKELIGKEASVYNISMHVKEYPFELLHICSHGGEVDGFSLIEEYTDSDGNTHVVEYDEVVSFAPHENQDKELIPVTSKMIFRKFDGLDWRSDELKSKKYPHYVFTEMVNELHKKEGKSRKRKAKIADSCAIKCADFNYQGMFNVLAGFHTSPVIFNNTCWSWSCISDSFLAVGARAYIGTLWEINNNVAKETAESFYDNLFNNTILEGLHKALIHTIGTESENIYVLWGLHFSTLKSGQSIQNSKENVATKILNSFYRWRAKLKTANDKSTYKNIERLINWNYNQLFKYFFIETIRTIKIKMVNKITQTKIL